LRNNEAEIFQLLGRASLEKKNKPLFMLAVKQDNLRRYICEI